MWINNFDVYMNLYLASKENLSDEGELVSDEIDDFDDLEEELEYYKKLLSSDKSLYVHFLLQVPNEFERYLFVGEIDNVKDMVFDDDTKNKIVDSLTINVLQAIHKYYGINQSEGEYERFSIKKLLNKYDVDINLANPVNILIGANGIGKSSIVKTINNYYNSDYISLLNIPFEAVTYDYIEDVNDGDKYKDAVQESRIYNELLPNVEIFKRNFEQYITNNIEMNNALAYKKRSFLLERMNVFFDKLIEENLYGEFVLALYQEKEFGNDLKTIVTKYVDERMLRNMEKPAILNAKSVFDHTCYEGSSVFNTQMDYKFTSHSYEWTSVYIDLVYNLKLDNEKVLDSAWRCTDIDWAICEDDFNRVVSDGKTYWEATKSIFVHNSLGSTEPEKTIVSRSRPSYYDQVKNKKVFVDTIENCEFSRTNMRNMIMPISHNGEKIVDLSILHDLKKDNIFKINKLIYENFYSAEFVYEINNQAKKYIAAYYAKWQEYMDGTFKIACEKYAQLMEVFKEKYLEVYTKWVRPILVKNSFFYINTEMYTNPFYYDCYLDGGTSDWRLKDKKPYSKEELEIRQKQQEIEMEKPCSEQLAKDTAYLEALMLYIENVTPCLQNEENINASILKYKEMLSKYIFSKTVEVTPSGLSVGEIDLTKISSGERKIIILFALNIFFERLILLLDEPELSLSIVWQESLVPDLVSCGSNKLIVATHSPFIAEDESLREYITYLPQEGDDLDGEE